MGNERFAVAVSCGARCFVTNFVCRGHSRMTRYLSWCKADVFTPHPSTFLRFAKRVDTLSRLRARSRHGSDNRLRLSFTTVSPLRYPPEKAYLGERFAYSRGGSARRTVAGSFTNAPYKWGTNVSRLPYRAVRGVRFRGCIVCVANSDVIPYMGLVEHNTTA